VTEIFQGNPAPLQLVKPEEKAASADIRNAIDDGGCPDRGKSRVPNSAGHYFVIEGPNAPDYAKVIVLPRTCPDRAVGYSTYYFLWENDKWIPVR
jgi:hypothetical protein